jgi:transposase
LRKIAQAEGVSVADVRRWLWDADIEVRTPAGPLLPEDVGLKAEEIRERYEEGAGIPDIAAWAGVGKSTAKRWVRESGAAIRTPERMRRELAVPDVELAERYDAGESMAAQARELEVSPSTIRKRIARGEQARRCEGKPVEGTKQRAAAREPNWVYVLAIAGVGPDCLVEVRAGDVLAERRQRAMCGRMTVVRWVWGRYFYWRPGEDSVCGECADRANAGR